MILKTSRNTKFLTRSKKGGVEDGVDDSNNGDHNNGNNCIGNSNKILLDIPKSMYSLPPLTSILMISLLTDSITSVTQIMLEYNRVNNVRNYSSDFDKKFVF